DRCRGARSPVPARVRPDGGARPALPGGTAHGVADHHPGGHGPAGGGDGGRRGDARRHVRGPGAARRERAAHDRRGRRVLLREPGEAPGGLSRVRTARYRPVPAAAASTTRASTAASGSAPSNVTRSLMIVFGTPRTW